MDSTVLGAGEAEGRSGTDVCRNLLKKNHPLLLYCINVNVSGMCFLSKVFYKAMQKDILYLCLIWRTHMYTESVKKK